MMKLSLNMLVFLFIFLSVSVFGQMNVPAKSQLSTAPEARDEDFIIKKPGEITFTSGVVIEGRVEKPQVMLVLTKERIKVEPVVFQRSFIRNITDPLRNNTFQISKGSGEEMGGAPQTQKERRK